jgi:hypothetical protein
MLEKLATHDVETVTTLFTPADKCARAAEGRAWHSVPQIGVTQTGGSGATAQGGGKKKKKNHGHDRPHAGAPAAVAAARGRDERSKRPRQQGGGNGSCFVHPNSHHSASECREILKLAKRMRKRREQASKDGSPPRRRPGKEKVDKGDLVAGEWDLGYQTPEQVLKDIVTGDSDSGDDDDRRKKLYVMYSGSWGPEGSSPSLVAEHHYLLWSIRLPRKHGRGRYTTAHHRPCHRQHAAASCPV